MQTMPALARGGTRAQIAEEGRRYLCDPRTIGQGIRLIQELSRSGRHHEAIDLARVLYEQRRKSRDLNVLMTVVMAQGATEEIREIARLAGRHHSGPGFDYDVQFLATWLRALYEVDDQPQFWQVFAGACAEGDKIGNLYVVGQYFRMLIRVGRYREVLEHWEKLDAPTKVDGFILKHKARALIELGRLLEAESTLAETRDDHLKRSLLGRLVDIKKRFGIREAEGARVGESRSPHSRDEGLQSRLHASAESRMFLNRPDRSKSTPPLSPEYFEGVVRMQPLVTEAQSRELEMVAVFFENGARTIPHTHATDQVLWVVEGTCLVVDEAGRREVGSGECVVLPANQWHWHGAAPGCNACHISIRKPGPTDWGVARGDW